MAAPRPEPVSSPVAEAAAIRALHTLLIQTPDGRTRLVNANQQECDIPPSVFRLLATAVDQLARGHAVAVTAVDTDLTTQHAADLLGVSRPFLVGLLESGAIPFHHVGTHRRVQIEDLLAFREERGRGRREDFKKA